MPGGEKLPAVRRIATNSPASIFSRQQRLAYATPCCLNHASIFFHASSESALR